MSQYDDFSINKIEFGNKKPNTIFSDIAQQAAKKIKKNGDANRSTQIRKFYDELSMWQQRIQFDEQKFAQFIPFVKMLKAKVAYSLGRGHVNEDFVNIFNRCIDQITDVKSLRDAKLFMESIIGFSKLIESQK